MKILAIDYGLKRVGFAISDELQIIAKPLGYKNNEGNQIIEYVGSLLETDNIELIIVGYPYKYDGEVSDFMEEINLFIDNLSNKFDVEVVKHDENYTSKIAVETMVNIGKKKKFRRQKGNTDSISAAVLLTDYLQSV